MERSHINAILRDAAAFFEAHRYVLPDFAHLAPDALRRDPPADLEPRRLGWDVTDYGGGRFDELGLTLFTARNGHPNAPTRGLGMTYAEKIMISRKHQLSPMHRHIAKTEDIVNRGGGRLVLELYGSDARGGMDRAADFDLPSDGRTRRLAAGTCVALDPGQSVTLHPGIWHAFHAEGADVLIGEVSTVNDDRTDNIFDPPLPRFATITEDAPPWRLLVSDYGTWL